MVFILKSIPIVEMKVVLNASSENLKDRFYNIKYYLLLLKIEARSHLNKIQVLPTPESPIRSSLKRRS